MNVLRGDIYYADLSPVVGSEQGGTRPVLIVQNDVGNKYSPTVIGRKTHRNVRLLNTMLYLSVFSERKLRYADLTAAAFSATISTLHPSTVSHTAFSSL